MCCGVVQFECFTIRLFRITGKEEMVDLYQEEAEVFKEKNYSHKERVLSKALQQAPSCAFVVWRA